MDNNFKFGTIEYVRPDFEKMKKSAFGCAEKIKNATSYDEAKKAFLDFDKEESAFFDMVTVASERKTYDRYERRVLRQRGRVSQRADSRIFERVYGTCEHALRLRV